MPYIKCVTVEQQNALEELKSRVKELTSPAPFENDALFYKFLKAKGFNVDKAEKILRKHIVWRKVHDVDRILETFKPKEVFVKYVEPSVIGFDKDGDIVAYIASGRINNTELFKCIKMNDCIKNWIWFAEKLRSCNEQQSNKTGIKTPITLIVDLEKLEFANAASAVTTDLFLRLTQLIRDHYAERLKSAYIINAPHFYVFVYNIIKTLMTNVMIKRIHVFGHNGWKEKFLEAIDPDVLPAFLGGNKTDPNGDPYCKSFMKLPDKISESYRLSEGERYFEDPGEVRHLIIPPSEKRDISIYVRKEGSIITWRFMVKSRSIRFGLFFQDPKEGIKEIIPIYEYNTSDGTEENSYTTVSKGKYIMVFDNTYSRFSRKEVQYTISVKDS